MDNSCGGVKELITKMKKIMKIKNFINKFIIFAIFLGLVVALIILINRRKQADRLSSEKEQIGAIIPEEKKPRMQFLDPKVLEVPGSYSPKTARLDEEIKSDVSTIVIDSGSPKLRFSVNGKDSQSYWLVKSLKTDKVSGNPLVQDNGIIWRGILPAIDLEYLTYNDFVEEILILDNDKAAKEFSFDMEQSENIILDDSTGGYVMVKDKLTAEDLFILKAPQGIDAKNQRIDYSYRLEGSNLVLFPSRKWQFENVQYPVRIHSTLSVISWEEALVQVGQNCSNPGCGEDGDLITIKPAGWRWSEEEKKNFVIVKIPKLNDEQRSEYLSRTLAAADTAEMTDAEKDNIKEKIYETGDLPRYGIDYTSVSSQEQIEQIRDKNQESPILDSSDNINIISRKDNLVSSVPSKRRLTYIDKRNSKFILFIYRFIKPVFAQTIIIKSIGTGAGRDYSTITAWESAQQGDLVLLNEIHKGEMYNDSPFDETLNIDGSITDANHYMWLTVAAGERHNGSASTGAVIDNQGVMGSTDVIGASDDYTKIEWIRFTGFNGINFGKAISIGAANITISKVIIHDFLDAINNVDGIRSTNGTGTVDNSIIYNGDRSGILIGLDCLKNSLKKLTWQLCFERYLFLDYLWLPRPYYKQSNCIH